MVFSNLIFLYLFLPANILLYYVTKNPAWRNGVLIVFSLFFYAWGEPVWVTLLIFSATIDYFHGLICEKYAGRWQAKAALGSSLVLNLGLLGIFKYSGMLVESINGLTGLSLPVPGFSLPIGISFYTFQTISYVIDVYRGQTHAQRSYWRFFMYVSMYPQLVAGPIVRYKDVAAQIDQRQTSREDFVSGISRFCTGLGKKVLIANLAGDFATQYLDSDLAALSTAGAWFGILMFSIQIYFDFSGYSDMAIGLARLFGFHYMENFNYPYISRSATEFWRRWHISLGSFFRDYVYIPMGGNRRHQFWNLLVVWFLTGLWHGASWNFILWGLYFAAWLILERYVLRGVLEKTPAILKHLYTLIVVFVGWGLFAMVDLGVCGDYLAACFGGAPLWSGADLFRLRSYAVTLAVLVLASTALGQRLWAKLPRQAEQLATPVLMGLSLVVCTAYLVDGSYNPFLYFRF